jgi:hypothetical protein
MFASGRINALPQFVNRPDDSQRGRSEDTNAECFPRWATNRNALTARAVMRWSTIHHDKDSHFEEERRVR